MNDIRCHNHLSTMAYNVGFLNNTSPVSSDKVHSQTEMIPKSQPVYAGDTEITVSIQQF